MSKGKKEKALKKPSQAPKKPRKEASRVSEMSLSSVKEEAQLLSQKEECQSCGRALKPQDRALFVEEEIGRVFCSEDCIAQYFTPEIERLEKKFDKIHALYPEEELTAEERQSLEHLRYVTLQEPDEVWREKTISGDYFYTLISEFTPGKTKLWYVCVCLFLRGEPSFLFIAFPTPNKKVVEFYRKGDAIENYKELKKEAKALASASGEMSAEEELDVPKIDGLAQPFTTEESYLAQLTQERSPEDIAVTDFDSYIHLAEQTLEKPDELWCFKVPDEALKPEDRLRPRPDLYSFIRKFLSGEDQVPTWYVILARETENEEEIEIIETFPTQDAHYVARYRQGEQQVTEKKDVAETRLIH